MQIGSADRRCADAHQYIARADRWNRHALEARTRRGRRLDDREHSLVQAQASSSRAERGASVPQIRQKSGQRRPPTYSKYSTLVGVTQAANQRIERDWPGYYGNPNVICAATWNAS